MAGAAAVHAPNGFFNAEGGYEYAATLGLAAAGLAVTGPGRLSLDHALGHVLDRGWMVPAALAGTAAVTALVVGARNRRVRKRQQGTQEALFEELGSSGYGRVAWEARSATDSGLGPGLAWEASPMADDTVWAAIDDLWTWLDANQAHAGREGLLLRMLKLPRRSARSRRR